MRLLVISILSLGAVLAIFSRRLFLVLRSQGKKTGFSSRTEPKKRKIFKGFFFFVRKTTQAFLAVFLSLLGGFKKISLSFYRRLRKKARFKEGREKIGQFLKTARRQARSRPSHFLKKIKKIKKKKAYFAKQSQPKNKALHKAEIFLNLKDYDTAEEYAFQAIQNNPKAQENYVFLARLYVLQNNFSDAAQCIEQAVKLGERDFGILLLGGEAFLNWGKKDKCYKMFKRAFNTASHKKAKAKALFRWGLACTSFGDIKQAKSLLSEAVALDRGKEEYMRTLNKVEEERGD